MPPTPPSRGCARTAAELAADLNERIRALWIGPGGHPTLRLSEQQRAEYHELLAELDRVERGDITAAA